MSFKTGQKVRIKGTDIVGQLAVDGSHDGIANVEVRGQRGFNDRALLADYYLPAELIEAVIEPVTVKFDPVVLPAEARTFYSHLRVNTENVDPGEVAIDGPVFKCGIALHRSEARKLAFAILTITEGEQA